MCKHHALLNKQNISHETLTSIAISLTEVMLVGSHERKVCALLRFIMLGLLDTYAVGRPGMWCAADHHPLC